MTPRTSKGKSDEEAVQPASCSRDGCPGCPLLGVPYPEQLAGKRSAVHRAFEKHMSADALPEVLPVRPSPRVFGYRASAKLSLARGPRGASAGIYARGSHRVVDLPHCRVHDPLLAQGVRALTGLLGRALGLLSRGVGGEGWLRYAALQASVLEGRLFVALVTRTRDDEGLLRSLAARLVEQMPAVAGVGWNVNPSPGNEIFGSEWSLLRGQKWILEKLGDLVFRASPSSFLQANREQAGWVYRMASQWLSPGPDEVGLDLYSGVGGLALHLAPRLRRVVGVEGSPVAVADATWTAASSHIENASFLAGRVEQILPSLLAEGYRPTLVSLNPPRKGAGAEVIEQIREAKPRAVLYVSCHPDSLARDAGLLCAGGLFRPILLQPVDFFPHTGHVETAALFRAEGPQA